MPYRYFLGPVIAVILIYFGYILYNNLEPNLWFLLFMSILIVFLFIFKHQINEWWWSKRPIELEQRDKNWIKEHIALFKAPTIRDDDEFFLELAKYCQIQEFIPMGDFKIEEEAKWMSLSPAIVLKIFKNPELYKHYIRTVFYRHPFLTPDQDYVHISEFNEEDGVLIFSIEQLFNANFHPDKYLNPALYEWSKIWSRQYLTSIDLTDHNFIKENICKQLQCQYTDILVWMGQNELDEKALLVYNYILYPNELQKSLPEYFQEINNILTE
ncbi:MAG: hypothetical protein HOP11_09065 [Saprospiraceae bacterium]|nr:hypothetical protein [Saprospiraceae bacterium]